MDLSGGYSEGSDGSDGLDGGAIGGAKGRERKKMFKEEHCSPGSNDVEGSCLDDDIVI